MKESKIQIIEVQGNQVKSIDVSSNDPKDKVVIKAARDQSFNLPKSGLTKIVDPNTGKVSKAAEDRTQTSVAAEVMLHQLSLGSLSIAGLSLQAKCGLYEYLYKYNPYVGRTVDLHTLLPMSSFRIQKPGKAANTLCRDYVHNFFDRMMNGCDFVSNMTKAVKYYYLYGRATVLVMDDYEQLKDTIVDDQTINSLTRKDRNTGQNKDRINKILQRYEADPDTVNWKLREEVLKEFGFDINLEYNGIRKLQILKPTDIKQIERNEDLDYEVYEIYRPDNIDKAYDKFKAQYRLEDSRKGFYEYNKKYEDKIKDEFIKIMTSVGYSRGYILTLLATRGQNTFKVDTNPYNKQGMYVTTFYRRMNDAEDSSSINRILDSAIDYTIARRKDREKANLAYKQNRLFSIKDGGPNQAYQLQQDIIAASSAQQGYDIITNLDVSYQDLSLGVKDQMDYQELKSNAHQDILVGLGMSESLLAGGETYSGAFLKVELLTTEYHTFRGDFSRFVQENLFKPTAVKRGFVVKDEWHNNTVVIPTVKFDRMSIARGTEDFNLLIQLVQSKMLPVKSVLTQLGYDYEDVQNELRLESTSIFNANIDAAAGTALQNLSGALATDTEFIKRLTKAMRLDPNFVENAQEMAKMQMGITPTPMQEAMMGEQPTEEQEEDVPQAISDDKIQEAIQAGYPIEEFAKLAEQGVLTPEQFQKVQDSFQQQNQAEQDEHTN